MLELPESYTLAEQCRKYLTGKIISEISILHTPHRFAFFHGETEEYAELLEGQKITGAVYHGGMLELDTKDAMIVFSDGFSPRYYEEKAQFPAKHQFALFFDDDTALCSSVRMYGFISVCKKGTCEEEYYISSSGKPDPLSDQFTYEYFRNLYPKKSKKLSAKAFLATEQRIPGLGNGVLQDILWEAGIDPRYNMQEASEEDFEALYQAVKKMLKKMCEDGGRDTEPDLFGRKGGYISQLSKNSLMEPCMKCGTLIQKANYMGGTIYYCEKCQKR